MSDHALRDHLVRLLRGEGAHLAFADAVADLPPSVRGTRPAGLPYSPWELVEHLRIAQHDILAFSRGPGHESPPWPDGYWPGSRTPKDAAAWSQAVRAFEVDNQAMQELVMDPKRDLFKPLPWRPKGEHQTLLREAMLVADHNSYHLGQLIVVRRLLGAWQG